MRYNDSSKINILYYKTSSGRDLVRDYIHLLDKETKLQIIAHIIKFKNDYEYRKAPYCKKLAKELFELRIKTKDSYRIVYAYLFQANVVFLHIFKKKSNRTPKKEIKLARKRLKLYKKSIWN